MSIEAMKQALEALESYHNYMEPLTTVFGGPRVPAEQSTTGKVEKAIASLRQSIEQAEKQEHQINQLEKFKNHVLANADALGVVLDAPAAQRQWVGLTDEEIEKGRDQTFSINNPYCPCDSKTMRKAVRWAEAKLKEKNT